MIMYVVYKLERNKSKGEYQILSIEDAYRWIQSGDNFNLRSKQDLMEINIPEIKKLFEYERILELLNHKGDFWIITKIFESE